MKRTAPQHLIPIAIISSVFLLMASCNIFNPTGSGRTVELNTKAKLIEAENYLRDGNNGNAEKLFNEVISEDSTLSKAYFGLAKAIFRKNEIDPLLLIELVDSFEDENPLQAAVNVSSRLPEENVEGVLLTRQALSRLIYRDSLQRIWNDSGIATPPYEEKDYPLTDGIITANRILIDYQILVAIETFNQLFDLALGIDCIPFIDEGCDFTQSALYQKALNSLPDREELIEQLYAMSDNFEEIALIAANMLDLDENGIIQYDGSTVIVDETLQEYITSADSLVNQFLDENLLNLGQ